MATVLPLLATIAGSPDASASCATLPGQGPGSVFAVPVAFVGSVVATSNGDREATVKVESIWRGPDMQTYVRVLGTPEPTAQATSVDRTYQVGRRYLFVPENASSPFQDNICTATQVFTAGLASQAPADARAPQPGGDPGSPPLSLLLPWIVAGGALLVAAAGFVLWIRRPDSGRPSTRRS